MKIIIIFIIVINLIFNINITTTILLVLKVIFLVEYSTLLLYTTKTNDLTTGLNQLLIPLKVFKINTNDIALMLSLSLRFIPSIFVQGRKILKAQASRGIDYKNGNLKDKILTLKSILIPLLVLSFKRADDLSDIMELRHYNYSNKRTNYQVNNWNKYDFLILSIHVIIFMTYIVSEVVR